MRSLRPYGVSRRCEGLPIAVRLTVVDNMKITLHLINDDPTGLREARIDQWSGRALCIPRRNLAEATKDRSALSGPCLYFLITPQPQGRKLKVYVGEADGFASRIRNHEAKRADWQTVVAFYSTDGSLTKTGIQYLESRCVDRLRNGGWCDLENANAPGLPTIPAEDRDGLELFAGHVATLMPILGFDIFSATPAEEAESAEGPDEAIGDQEIFPGREFDTVVCPVREEGFVRAFLGQHAYWAIRIADKNRSKIKYIAMYQVAPISAITYYGEVDRIERFENSGKYKLYLKGAPTRLDPPIGMGKNRHLKPQASKYTTIEAIKNAKTLDDVFGPRP
jgi:hypothetical protein